MLKKMLKNERGLTLIELLAVVVILGIIAAIAVPAIGNVIQNSKYDAVKAEASNIINAAKLFSSTEDIPAAGVDSELLKKNLDNVNYFKDTFVVKKTADNSYTLSGDAVAGKKEVTFKDAKLSTINGFKGETIGTEIVVK